MSDFNNNETYPKNNLVWAILCTCFCCVPFGVVSIVKSTSVNSLWTQGRHDEARQAAADSKKWAKWGAISCGIFIVVYIIIVLIVALVNL